MTDTVTGIGWTDADVDLIPPFDRAKNMARYDRRVLAEMEGNGVHPFDLSEYQRLSQRELEQFCQQHGLAMSIVLRNL